MTEAVHAHARASLVRDNAARQRFELDLGNSVAFANYRRKPGVVIITHTETPASLRGRGIGSELVAGALALIRSQGERVVAGCSFIADYLAQHPEWHDLEAERG